MPGKKSEVWKGARRGAGWAIGMGAVASVAVMLREGPRQAMKVLVTAGIRGREAAAELSEQMRDIYAEAQVERAAAPPPENEVD
jgi:hypothetical protein